MKRIVWMALLALALPLSAFAGSTDLANQGGTLTGSSAGLVLTGSTLVGVENLYAGGTTAGDLGTVSFTTGSLVSETATSAVFNGGGSFTITGNGTNGVPNGVIFSGTFGTVTLSCVSCTSGSGSEVWLITAPVSGTLGNGQAVSGPTFQSYLVTGKDGIFSGTVGSGDTIVSTPEPGTLGLLGTGLVGLAGVIRKKLKA